jgi:hypothetical protein
VKIFEMQHLFIKYLQPVVFDENTAPKWLCEGGVAGSTMDTRWFWNEHVMTLSVGQTVDTDFHRITRVS